MRLVVLFGGRSAEHDVSCVSAVSVLGAADPSRYDVVPVGITRDGQWVMAEPAAGAERLQAEGEPVDPFAAVEGSIVFPLLHGPFGEDGTVQGLCEMAGVPYVGSGVLGSAIGMDKIVTKHVVSHAGLPVARYIALRYCDLDGSLPARVEAELGWPVFVKPANLGSSIGVCKVAGAGDLAAALQTALEYDEWLLVEEAIAGREIECGVLEVPGAPGTAEASSPGEIEPGREFYDYDDKYVDGRARLLVPAGLPAAVAAEVKRMAVATFAAVRAEGMARVDFFYDAAGRGLLVNEVNTIPGFTPISMFPKMWEAAGVSYPALIDRLVELAVERHRRRTATGGRRCR